MDWLSFSVSIILLVAVVILLIRLRQQSNKLAELQREQAELAADWRAGPVEFDEVPGSKLDPAIVIQILNPAELAANESPVAGTITNFAPDFIKRTVYKRASDILRDELLRNGVQVEVMIHGLD